MEDQGEYLEEVNDVDMGNEPMSDNESDDENDEFSETDAERNMQYVQIPEQGANFIIKFKDMSHLDMTPFFSVQILTL